MNATSLVWLIGEATAVLIVALLFDRWLARRRALAVAALWNAVLFALLILPLAALLTPRVELPWLPALVPPHSIAPRPSAQISVASSTTRIQPSISKDKPAIPAPENPPHMPSRAAPRQAMTGNAAVPASAARPTVAQVVMAGYVVGTVLGGLGFCASWWAVRRLRTLSVTVVAEVWQTRLDHWLGELGVATPVELLTSNAVSVPLALGVRRPATVLPVRLSIATIAPRSTPSWFTNWRT